MSDPSSSTQDLGWSSIMSTLTASLESIRKISQAQNISNDSGVSFSSFSQDQIMSDSASSNTSSTVTQQQRDPTSEAHQQQSEQPSQPQTQPPIQILSLAKPFLADQGEPYDMVTASPSILRPNDSFFSKVSASRQGTLEGAHSALGTSPSSHAEDFQVQEVWRATARQLKPIGDVLRSDRLRTPLGKSSLPSECVCVLELSLIATSSNKETRNAISEAQVEAMRVMANLCIDHDENRDSLHAVTGASSIIRVISHAMETASNDSDNGTGSLLPLHTLTLLRTAIGALLNMQIEHRPTRRSFMTAEALGTLALLASNPRIYVPDVWSGAKGKRWSADPEALEKIKMGATIASWSWRVVQEVSETEEEPSVQHRAGSIVGDDDEDNDTKALLTQDSVGAMLWPLLSYAFDEGPDQVELAGANPLNLDADDVADLIEADAEILLAAAELIEGCALDEVEYRKKAVLSGSAGSAGPIFGSETNRFDSASSRFRSPLDLFMAFVENASPPAHWQAEEGESKSGIPSPSDPQVVIDATKSFAKTKAAVVRAIVAIAGEDANMVGLFGGGLDGAQDAGDKDSDWFIESLKAWIRYDSKQRDDLVSCGMLAMGNLARKDSHCLALVNYHKLAPFLASMMSPTNDIKVSHGLVSLLKNLSIPAPNKAVIGSLGIIQSVAPFLAKDKDMVQPLQFATVGLMKHLCAEVPENAMQVINASAEGGEENAPSSLDALIALINRVDDVPTKMEATRVIVNLVRTLWSSKKKAAAETADSTTTSKPVVSPKVAEARQKLIRKDVTDALAEMVRLSPKYPVLVNEGIFALTLLGSERSGARLVARSLLQEPGRTSPDPDSDGAEKVSSRKRRGTYDSSTSTSSQPPPPPPSSLAMVCSVLARRDARMLPEHASNACMLVTALCQARKGSRKDMDVDVGAAGGDTNGDDVMIVDVVTQTRPALVKLRDHGPPEALEYTKAALALVDEVEKM